jgi:hypothetical protein
MPALQVTLCQYAFLRASCLGENHNESLYMNTLRALRIVNDVKNDDPYISLLFDGI